MDNALDDFVEELTEQILEETKGAYGELAYERWRKPLFMGVMEDPDGYARLQGACGDSMEIFLKFEEDSVKEASFRADGCGSSTVCGSYAAEMSIGKDPRALLEITGQAIIEKLEGLPKEDEHLAFLAAEALHQALNNYLMKKSGQGH